MANGVYGTNVPAVVTQDDIDIYYSYREDRNDDTAQGVTFEKLSPNILSDVFTDYENTIDGALEGLYNLRLPVSVFNQKGFYTVYIKPREIRATIKDVSVLSSYPEIKGIIFNIDEIDDNQLRNLLQENNSLVGYRIIYFDNNKRQNYYRIITSNNRCEPIIQSLSGSNQKSTRYRFNDVSNLVFITLTPSMASTFKPNAEPYIGMPAQEVAFVNTKFEPIMLEIEMVDHDADTISTMLEGAQLRDLDNGLVTTFNENNEIYHQAEHYSLKDSYTAKPIYEVKKNRTSTIDYTQTIDDK